MAHFRTCYRSANVLNISVKTISQLAAGPFVVKLTANAQQSERPLNHTFLMGHVWVIWVNHGSHRDQTCRTGVIYGSTTGHIGVIMGHTWVV